MSTFKLLKELKKHSKWVWDIAFSSDGDFLVSGSSDSTMMLWDLKKFEDIKTYTGHQKSIVTISFNDIGL
jgi:WD40 repeat protein